MWYLFYNAKNKENGNWNEQIGVAFLKIYYIGNGMREIRY